MPKKGVDSPATLEAESASSSGEHHHSGRIVPKKGVEAGDEDDGGIRNGFCHLQLLLIPCREP